MILRRFSFLLAAALSVTATGAFADSAKPIRHLVYNFGVTFATTATQHTSGFSGDGPASGVADYRTSTNDDGTITVDVLTVQPDTGLVVRIAEQGRNQRNSAPKMCVVYGTGSTICDQSTGQINVEELALLRFLGRNFVNTAQIDAKNHWRYSTATAQASETSDYTIGKKDGNVLDISYERTQSVGGDRPFKATTDGSLSYNELLSVPVSVKEQTLTHKNAGLGGNYDTVEQDVTLSLASDSMQQSAAQNH